MFSMAIKEHNQRAQISKESFSIESGYLTGYLVFKALEGTFDMIQNIIHTSYELTSQEGWKDSNRFAAITAFKTLD